MTNVRVYRNLHRHCYSVQTKINGRWKVTDHKKNLALADVIFKVYEAGRLRTIKEKQKRVHAYAIGKVCEPKSIGDLVKIRYNPYSAGHFQTPDDSPVDHAKYVEFNEDGVFIGT